KSILIYETKVAQASREIWSAHVNFANELGLQPAYHRLDVISDKCGVGADGLQGTRYDPLRLATPCRREVAQFRGPLRMVLVPNPHDLVHAATVHAAGQATHLVDEVLEKRRAWCKFLVVDIAIQGLVQSENES